MTPQVYIEISLTLMELSGIAQARAAWEEFSKAEMPGSSVSSGMSPATPVMAFDLFCGNKLGVYPYLQLHDAPIRELVRRLIQTNTHRHAYIVALHRVVQATLGLASSELTDYWVAFASSEQIAEALLRFLGKWNPLWELTERPKT